MFTLENFATLYNILDLSFFSTNFDIDCGSPSFSACQRFCCISNNQRTTPTKWLLPDEERFLVQNYFDQHANIQKWDYMFVYSSFEPGVCACERIRQYRPFCCRIFPFRPLLDVNSQQVMDIARNQTDYFSTCWLNYPSRIWHKRAIQAWQFVLSDLDNLRFFSKLYLIIEESKRQPGVLFSEALKDNSFSNKINALPNMNVEDLWYLSSKYFIFSLS